MLSYLRLLQKILKFFVSHPLLPKKTRHLISIVAANAPSVAQCFCCVAVQRSTVDFAKFKRKRGPMTSNVRNVSSQQG